MGHMPAPYSNSSARGQSGTHSVCSPMVCVALVWCTCMLAPCLLSRPAGGDLATPALHRADLFVHHPPCRNGTWCVCWSPSNEFQLFSGDGSGAVRLWDIRRSGCRAMLDFNTTQRPSRPTAAASTPTIPGAAPARKRARSRAECSPHQQQPSLPGVSGLDGGWGSRTAGAAVAHEGAVTGLLAMQDGLSLVSAGTDHRVRLWDAGGCRVPKGSAHVLAWQQGHPA